MKHQRNFRKAPARGCVSFLLLSSISLLMVACVHISEGTNHAFRPASTLPDLSGIAWISEDLFLAVHDAKSEKVELPRVSLIRLPKDRESMLWLPLPVEFPGHPSSDLESAARIPAGPSGVTRVLLAESSSDLREPPSRRIFLAELRGRQVEIVDAVEWPVPTTDVEGTAVAWVGEHYLFIYAERAEGKGKAEVRFADLELHPLRLGVFKSAGEFSTPYPTGLDARPITAMDVDDSGEVYVASAEDPDNDGPFRSAVYRIGKVVQDLEGMRLVLYDSPFQIATLDGLKVESLTIRSLPGKGLQAFVGTDDENYGGVLRPIPMTVNR